MGLSFSTLFDQLLTSIGATKEYRILMIGLDAAGKTTVLYKLKLGEIVNSIPTIGFNVETVQYRNITFTVWDVGGQNKIRPLWRHYYEGAQGMIFVVDSNDSDRFAEAAREMRTVLADESMKDAIVLILANKQDLPHAVPATEMCEKLGLRSLTHQWYIQPCSAVKCEGLFEGLDWLSTTLATQS